MAWAPRAGSRSLVWLAAFVGSLVPIRQPLCAEVPTGHVTLTTLDERFACPRLNDEVWKVTRQNDFQESTVDIKAAPDGNGRLRLRAATIGTDDRTVKYHGIRTVQPAVDLGRTTEVSFELDWNRQTNGCYLRAGVYLCPVATDAGPCDARDWLKVEYVGVPPGKNARCLVASRTDGHLKLLFTEGWPREQRTGRRIGVQRVRLRIDARSLRLFENGKLLLELPEHKLAFTKAHLYVQMSSHSNYPPRELFFDNIQVRQWLPDREPGQPRGHHIVPGRRRAGTGVDVDRRIRPQP